MSQRVKAIFQQELTFEDCFDIEYPETIAPISFLNFAISASSKLEKIIFYNFINNKRFGLNKTAAIEFLQALNDLIKDPRKQLCRNDFQLLKFNGKNIIMCRQEFMQHHQQKTKEIIQPFSVGAVLKCVNGIHIFEATIYQQIIGKMYQVETTSWIRLRRQDCKYKVQEVINWIERNY